MAYNTAPTPAEWAPAQRAKAFSKSDSVRTDSATGTGGMLPRAVYVGGGGDLVVKMDDGSGTTASVTFTAVPTGAVLAIRPTHIMSSTSASAFVLLW